MFDVRFFYDDDDLSHGCCSGSSFKVNLDNIRFVLDADRKENMIHKYMKHKLISSFRAEIFKILAYINKDNRCR